MLATAADDDAVGPLEVADRGALAQELGVRDDVDLQIGPRLAADALDLVAGADRDGRLGDDDERPVAARATSAAAA